MISHVAVLLPQPSTLMYIWKNLKRGKQQCAHSQYLRSGLPFLSHTFSVSDTQTRITRCTASPPPTVPTPLHPHSGSSCHHLSATPQKPIQTAAPHRHGMLAKGDGVLSGARLQPPSPPPPPQSLPPRCFLTFPQHAWCISRVARQHDRTAPENLWELFCTLCDLLKFLQNCVCVCVCVCAFDATLILPLHGYTIT